MSESERSDSRDKKREDSSPSGSQPLVDDADVSDIDEIFRRYVAHTPSAGARVAEIPETRGGSPPASTSSTLMGIQDLEDPVAGAEATSEGSEALSARVLARDSADDRFGVKASVVTSRQAPGGTMLGLGERSQQRLRKDSGTMAGLPMKDLDALDVAAEDQVALQERASQLSEEWVDDIDHELDQGRLRKESGEVRTAILRKPGGLSTARTLRERLQSGEVEALTNAAPESRYVRSSGSARRGAASGSMPGVSAPASAPSQRTQRGSDTLPDLEIDTDEGGVRDTEPDPESEVETVPMRHVQPPSQETPAVETPAAVELDTADDEAFDDVSRIRNTVFDPEEFAEASAAIAAQAESLSDDASSEDTNADEEEPFHKELTGDDDLDALLYDEDEDAKAPEEEVSRLRLADPHADARDGGARRERAVTGLYDKAEDTRQASSRLTKSEVARTRKKGQGLPGSLLAALGVGLVAALLYLAWWLELFH